MNFFQILHNFFAWFDQHNGLIQAIATVVLVVITYRSIKEAQNTRKDNRLPIIKFKIIGPINYAKNSQNIRMELHAENIGYGLALDVKLNFMFSPMQEVDFGNIETGAEEIVSFKISYEQIEQMKKATKMFDVIVLSYKDIFDRTLTTFASIIDKHENDTAHDWPVIEVSKWRVILPE